MQNSIIEVSDLTKSFGANKAVNGISFNVISGSFFAFLGQNGAGKSTTINMLIGLLQKDSGHICYSGNNGIEEFMKDIGVVFQSNVFDDRLSVRENLLLVGTFYTKDRTDLLKRYEELILMFELKDIVKQRFGTLSGGQKRKVEIARALFCSPKILFLDEPTTGLDPKTRREVWSILHKIRKDTGTTLFLTTHYMEETVNADKVVIIHKGEKLCEGSPTELKSKYSTDKLFIVPKNVAQFEEKLEKNSYAYEKTADNYVLKIDNIAKSIDFLNKFKHEIRFYEVKKGSMDDVFLSVVGESLNREQAQ